MALKSIDDPLQMLTHSDKDWFPCIQYFLNYILISLMLTVVGFTQSSSNIKPFWISFFGMKVCDEIVT